MVKILVVGQTPPPFGGQAIMIQKMLDGHYDGVRLFHVRMAFSKEMGEVSQFKLRKVYELIRVIYEIIKARLKFKPEILYYPPAGPRFWPVLRDIVILISTRWLFKKTIFHFHAGGLNELYNQLPRVAKFFLRLAYFAPDAAIHISEFSPEDGYTIKARKVFIVPYGIEDVYHLYHNKHNKKDGRRILFVGALYESKGIFDLLEACRILKMEDYDFRVSLMGQGSTQMIQTIKDYLYRYELHSIVELLGTRIGDEKWLHFSSADIFCFPTYFEAENLPVVILEAMMFGLPIVSTLWRGIPSLVRDGENGFLVPIKSPDHLAEKLGVLLKDKNLRDRMGQRSREIYLSKFTVDKFFMNMQKVFLETDID